MGKSVASADITTLDFSVLLDLSVATPYISITNLSAVINAANLQWFFDVYSPSGTPIHISGDTPDIDGQVWTTFQFPEAIPKYFGQVEFTTKPYTVKVRVQATDTTDELTKGASVCVPNGNAGKGNFGKAWITMELQCSAGAIIVTDQTNLLYKDITGTQKQTHVELDYPMDLYGNQPDPVIVQSIPARLPILAEGEGHQLYVFHVYEYDLGDNFFVRIRYTFTETFPVWCDVTLQPLFCEIDKITAMLEGCTDNAETREMQRKLTIANTKMLKAMTGIIQPLSGIDVPGVIKEIEDLLGIECDCHRPAGVPGAGNLLVADANFVANKVCGDMLLSWTTDGAGNIVLNYQNVMYVFQIADSDAFTYQPTLAGCTKTVVLKVDIEILTQEMINELAGNQSLLNQLNALLTKATLACSGIDGKSLFNSNECDYSATILTTPAGTAMKSVVITGGTYLAPGGLLANNTTGIVTWLNSLAAGVFTAVYDGVSKTTISSLANTHALSTISTTSTAGDKTVQFTNNCGLICTILQQIIDWGDALNFADIKGSKPLSVCSFNPDGTVNTQIFIDYNLEDIATIWSNALCNITSFMATRHLSCANMKAIFAPLTGTPNGADTIFGTVSANCGQIPIKNLALGIFDLLGSDPDVKSRYCINAKCSTVSDCVPVSGLAGSIGATAAVYTWASVIGAIGYKWSIDGTTWFNVTSTAANVTGLTAGTAYTFRVYPVYNTGDGTACVVSATFTTTSTGGTCAAPASLTFSSITSNSIFANWPAVTGASGYQYRLNGGTWLNAGSVLGIYISGLMPSTNYIMDVRAMIGGVPCVEMVTANATTLTAINGTLAVLTGLLPVTQGTPNANGSIAAASGSVVNVRIQMSGTDAAASLSYNVNGTVGSINNATSPVTLPITMPSTSITWLLSLTTSVSSEGGNISLV